MTEQQLTTAIYDSLAAFQMTAQLSSLQHAQMRKYLTEHLAGTLTPLLADARVQAIRDLADKADPQRPEISFFGDHGHIVGEWMRKQAEYEQQRLIAGETPAQLPGGFKRTTAVTVDCAACGYHFDETEFIHAFDSVEEAVDTVVGAGWDELRDGRVICEDQDEKHEALRSEVGVVNDSDEA
jgi:hypothetical protein